MRIRSVALTFLISLAASFSASANNKKNTIHPFLLRSAVTLNGAEVPEGLYNLTLETSNANVRVTLWKDGQFVATAPGSWVKSGAKYTEDAALLRVNSDGTRTLIEIRLAGSAKTIVLNSSEPVVQLSAKSPHRPLPPQDNPADGESSHRKMGEIPALGVLDTPAAGR